MSNLLESLETSWGLCLGVSVEADAIRMIGKNQVKIAKAFDEHKHQSVQGGVTGRPVVVKKEPSLLEAAEAALNTVEVFRICAHNTKLQELRAAVEREKAK